MRTITAFLLCFFGSAFCRADNPKSIDEWQTGYLVKQAMEAFVERAIAENEEQPRPVPMVIIAVTNEHLAGAVAIFRPSLTGDNTLHSVRFERKLDGFQIVPIKTQLSFEKIVALADTLIEKAEQKESSKIQTEGAFEALQVYRSTSGESKTFELNFPKEEGIVERVLEEFLFPDSEKNG